MATLPPTLIQVRILSHLRKAEEDGRTPSYRELAAAFGWRAVATVRDHVAALAAKGLVTLAPHQARSLRLTETGREAAVAMNRRPAPLVASDASLSAAA